MDIKKIESFESLQNDFVEIKEFFQFIGDDWDLFEVKDCWEGWPSRYRDGVGYYSLFLVTLDDYIGGDWRGVKIPSGRHLVIDIILPFKDLKITIDQVKFKNEIRIFKKTIKKMGYECNIYYIDFNCRIVIE